MNRFILPAVSLLVLLSACGGGSDSTEPQVPARLEAVVPTSQTGTVAAAVAQSPSVRVVDKRGHTISNVAVTFSVTSGGGTLARQRARTNASGIATAPEWLLGTQAGTNTARATVGDLTPVDFTVTAVASAPTRLAFVAPPVTTVAARAVIAPGIQVQLFDIFGNAARQAGVVVTASTASTGATLFGGTTATTDASGIATFTTLAVGGTVGQKVVDFTAPALTPVSAPITLNPGPAAVLQAVAGDATQVSPGATVPVAPAVRVQDLDGNVIGGIPVTFQVVGGGNVTGAVATSNALGIARVGSWTVAGAPGTSTVQASAAGTSAATFSALVTAPAFNVTVRFLSGMTPSQTAAFNAAAARWGRLILGDVPDIFSSIPANACGITHPALSEPVDDVLIFAEVAPIDGVGGILGQAGPCYLRGGSRLPTVGVMSFDVADVASMEANGTLTDVIMHEMGHVLGFGTLWGSPINVLTGAGTTDPLFSGLNALAAFRDIGSAGYGGAPIPVENTGGSGTRDAHWRKSVFNNELMTGSIRSGVSHPLSIVTVAAMRDVGYVVDMSAANTYTLGQIVSARPAPGSVLVDLGNDLLLPKYEVTPVGTTRRIAP